MNLSRYTLLALGFLIVTGFIVDDSKIDKSYLKGNGAVVVSPFMAYSPFYPKNLEVNGWVVIEGTISSDQVNVQAHFSNKNGINQAFKNLMIDTVCFPSVFEDHSCVGYSKNLKNSNSLLEIALNVDDKQLGFKEQLYISQKLTKCAVPKKIRARIHHFLEFGYSEFSWCRNNV
jgi:hypothetical protein